MKKLPRKIKHWANESFQALYNAIELLKEEHVDPSEQEKLELIAYAPLFVCMNRGIKDKETLRNSQQHTVDGAKTILEHLKQEGRPVDHCFVFLMAYLELHVYHGYLTNRKSEEIVQYIGKNYDESLSI